MQKLNYLACIIFLFLILPAFSMNIFAEPTDIPDWNSAWSYEQELDIPIDTELIHAKYQPVDMQVNFDNPCWANNEEKHSVRILCWDGNSCNELESQIYDLKKTSNNFIKSCRIIFLIPSFANGYERYFVYYDNKQKADPDYEDHVSIEDSYYYFEPISGVSAEGDFYAIMQEDNCIYGIGQKGKVLNRYLSQAVIKLKPGTSEFDIPNSDNLATFCFSYHRGSEEEDEISSDQRLVSKNILSDGNLMVSCGIVSESSDKNLRTTGIYKYYYTPTVDKRLCANIKHQVFDEGIVKGITNVDGRYGALFSYESKSSRIQKMRFGEILPYLHVYGENDKIKEYHLNLNPEDQNREWIIPYSDDCDLGSDAWISYDEGRTGKAHGILFSSNEEIVKYGTEERDGIQIKVAERELLDVLGAEIDYAIINFGRNSYEVGGSHDLDISEDLVVEYCAEFFTSEEGGYQAVIDEGKNFRNLVKLREDGVGDLEGDEDIHTLTVIPRLTGRILSHPFLSNFTGISISKIIGELYSGEELVSIGTLYKPIIGAPRFKFTKIKPGDYFVKIYRKLGDRERKIIGLDTVNIKKDEKLDIYCTWQKDIRVQAIDQNSNFIENIELKLFEDEIEISKNYTTSSNDIKFRVPLNIKERYILKAFYKGFKVYEDTINTFSDRATINLALFDLQINIRDNLGFSPGVDVRPRLTSSEMINSIELVPKDMGNGIYVFKDLPESIYDLYISYGGYENEKSVNIAGDEEQIDITFSAIFDLEFNLFDSMGNILEDDNLKLSVYRQGKEIFNLISPEEKLKIPPGIYNIKVYSDEGFVGEKTLKLSADKNENIVTNIESKLPILVIGLSLIFILEIIVVLLIKRISLNTFLKLLAISLIIISIFLPWWSLYAENSEIDAEKTSEMYIYPQTIIESVSYEEETYFEIATIPEIFSDFLSLLFSILIIGLFLICFSFIPNLLYRKRFYKVLISASLLFVFIVGFAFYIGVSKVTDFSLGSISDKGIIKVSIPPDTELLMNADWGLSTGFYIFIIAAILLVIAGIIDYLRKKELLRI